MKITAIEYEFIIHALGVTARGIKRRASQEADETYPKEKDLRKRCKMYDELIDSNKDYKMAVSLIEKLRGTEIDLEVE